MPDGTASLWLRTREEVGKVSSTLGKVKHTARRGEFSWLLVRIGDFDATGHTKSQNIWLRSSFLRRNNKPMAKLLTGTERPGCTVLL